MLVLGSFQGNVRKYDDVLVATEMGCVIIIGAMTRILQPLNIIRWPFKAHI
jgi:hypothetical protein